MFRALCRPLLVAVPYASLFGHNKVLEQVFKAPSNKVALSFELPGTPKADYTYGQLQNDVIELSNVIVMRKEAVAGSQKKPSLSWMQPSKPDHVRSIFAQGERTPSTDYMKDTGFYTASVLCAAGYPFVVSVLACWALNQLVTPMSISQRYNDELMYVLEHSGSRLLISETAQLKEKIPAVYDRLLVRSTDEARRATECPARSTDSSVAEGGTFMVDTVMDARTLISQLSPQDSGSGGAGGDTSGRARRPLEVEWLPPAPSECGFMSTAEDVVQRLEREKASAKQREIKHLEELRKQQHAALNSAPEDENQPLLCFDSEQLNGLNPVFRKWYEDPASRPKPHDDCLMIYTSGTTARPKGAVHTHASVSNMVRVLQVAWQWTKEDSILHMLPVHHIHGLVNILLCALASNARCVMTRFDNPARIAHRIEQGDISLVMAVPTIYTKIITAVTKQFSPIERTGFRKACAERVRLMVSGSAALPVPTLDQFRELSGHTLLERYGMTEIGMSLSQPLRPVSDRIPGTVGSPLPTVTAYVYHPSHTESEAPKEGRKPQQAHEGETPFNDVGTLAIASASLFDRYWNNPVATRKEVRTNATGMRFFSTGDTVGVRHGVTASSRPVFTILGRTSVDIIKSRGYKLSALEIEAALLSRKDLFYEVAVVGVEDAVRGEAVVAIVALQPEAAKARNITFSGEPSASFESPELTEEMKSITRGLQAPYKCPSRFVFVPEIPRNPTGKVNKKNLKKLLNLA